MTLLKSEEGAVLRNLSELGFCNPFLPERVDLERRILGDDFVESEAVWSLKVDDPFARRDNTQRINELAGGLVEQVRERLARGSGATEHELGLYDDAVVWLTYHRYGEKLFEALDEKRGFDFYPDFRGDWDRYFSVSAALEGRRREAAHVFACFFQVRRAFHYIFRFIIGGSLAAARLRASVWQSIFTHDMRRYRRSLYRRMGDFATLITGPSGTGKELVAQAVGWSRYLPFDPVRRCFSGDFTGGFFAINLSALPPTLVESELFGHLRGAFTGAVKNRAGWLEACPALGTVFLDEIGDLDGAIQVKLLRVIQTRTFQRLGETGARRFQGKLIAATHRDLAALMREGRFREDLYYRLCSDIVVTPSLHEQLRESTGVLGELLRYLAQGIVGDEAGTLAREAESWILDNLGRDYPWPGNFRELEQCVRNVLIRKQYHPPSIDRRGPADRLFERFRSGDLTAEELLSAYCTWVYAGTGNYQETSRRIGLDRRTVKSKVDTGLLEEFRQLRS